MSNRCLFALTTLAGCLDAGPADDPDTSITTAQLSASPGDDIVVLGSSMPGAGIVTAFSTSAGNFEVVNSLYWFADAAKSPGVKRLTGDFNRDGRMDLALVGGQGWNTIPLACSNGDGTWTITNQFVGFDFNIWASTQGVTALVGDYNRDGYADIALTGAAGWNTIPVAFANTNGNFDIRNYASGLASFASMGDARPIVGDFNKDGYSDIAIIGLNGSPFVPVSFAAGGGTWQTMITATGAFNQFVDTPHTTVLVGDYNKDGYTDLAVTGGSGWGSIPVLFSNGLSPWQVTNNAVPSFGSWASAPNVKALAGDFNKDGYTDIALVGGTSGAFPVAFSTSGGNFAITNQWAGWNDNHALGLLASQPGITPLVGDFDGDGYSDIAFTGPSTWTSIPVAFGFGGGWWWARNMPLSYVPSLTGEAGVTLAVGRVN